MKKYDFAFVTKNAKADLKKAMQQYLDFETFRNDYGWADWMNDFTDAEDGESCTEEEIRIIDEVIYQVWEDLKYYVVSPYKTSDDVEILLRTGDLNEAKAEADYFASRGQSVEVQEVTVWNFGGYDYNVVYKKLK